MKPSLPPLLFGAFLSLGCGALAIGCAAPSSVVPGARPFAHPLDPLTADEIRLAVKLLKLDPALSPQARFAEISLQEPSKENLRQGKADQPPPREAVAVVYDRKSGRTFEAVVDLTAGKVRRFELVAGAQPMIMKEEFEVLPELVQNDPRVRQALLLRGISDPKQVQVDVWAPGHRPVAGVAPGTRLARCLFFHLGEATVGYGRPIENLLAVVNLDTREVVQVVDTGHVAVAPQSSDFFDPAQVGKLRPALKPLHVSQPEGVSFTVRGQEIIWDKWHLRYTHHPHKGLVLHQVGYEDDGKLRSILHRASVAEICVPYGDPAENWRWRAAMDEGEYGLGQLAQPLVLGRDVPENAQLLDAVLADDKGEPYVIKGGVAVYERDGGLLWTKKDDYQTQKVEARRGRELVLHQVVTVGNYDYGFNWIFTQSGEIRAEVELTGMLLAKGVETKRCQRCETLVAGGEAAGEDRYGTVVASGIVAPNHQHFFNYRLDFDIDGVGNSVSEMNMRADGASSNSFQVEEAVLRNESVATRDGRAMSCRHWRVFNPTVRTGLGHFPGYMLEPMGEAMPIMAEDAPVRSAAAFINHPFWVTAFHEGERYAAGAYPNQSAGGDGLGKFTANAEPLENTDLVVWHTFGLTHAPRPEEWPVMPVSRTGFRLVPKGFFTRNPALDVGAGR